MANIDTGAIHIGTLLRDSKQYLVPEFQRDYSWTDEQIDQLWKDVFEAISGGSSDYFIGSMVINDSNSSYYQVIDGQQRLTTISILLCALRDHANLRKNASAASSISADFLGKLDYSSQEIRPKLVLNRNNKDYYSERVVNAADVERLRSDRSRRGLSRSNRKIAQAYVYLYDAIDKKLEEGLSFNDLLGQLVDAIDNMIQVIRISVKDDYDAYLLFETLNDRGLALSVADLLKNYIFSQAGDRLMYVQDNWRMMSDSLEQIETKRFLRHYWLSNHGVVRDKDLYKKIRGRFTTKAHIEKLSRELRDSAEVYAALGDPASEIWSMFTSEQRGRIFRLLGELKVFGVNQYNPLLLAMLEENQPEFEKTLRLVIDFAFRYSIILQSGTGNIERTFTEAALYVRNNKSATAREVYERIKDLYPSDDEFLDAFAYKSMNQSSIARYTLRKINDFWEKDRGSRADEDAYALNLEHVFPQKYNIDEWPTFQGMDDPSEYVGRIGNMTLISGSMNRKMSNSSFSEKREKGYSTTDRLAISNDIFEAEEWTPELIEERQRKMAEVATEIWSYRG